MTVSLRNAVVVCLAALACGCSSVPDVVFADGGTGGSSGTSTSGGSSGGQPPPPPPDWSCPTKQPPTSEGICCGNRICLKCTASDCTKCEQEGCAGTVSAACCRRNPAQMQCRAHDDC